MKWKSPPQAGEQRSLFPPARERWCTGSAGKDLPKGWKAKNCKGKRSQYPFQSQLSGTGVSVLLVLEFLNDCYWHDSMTLSDHGISAGVQGTLDEGEREPIPRATPWVGWPPQMRSERAKAWEHIRFVPMLLPFLYAPFYPGALPLVPSARCSFFKPALNACACGVNGS